MTSPPVLIIAEAGVNHNGQRDLAFSLIDAAHDAGADCVKFQSFNATRLASKTAPKAAYQLGKTDAAQSQLEMLKALELPKAWHADLQRHARQIGITFISTAFDLESLNFLNTLDLPFYKIPSGEITNALLLWHFAHTGKKVILSTGMATLSEVEQALAILAHGMTHHRMPASLSETWETYATDDALKLLTERVTILHCTSQYPTPMREVNLSSMQTLRDTFHLPVGYSDHTQGITIPIAAAALGATVIEKHFTLDRNLPGPDHLASLEPGELKQMVEAIREIGDAIGTPYKRPQPSEWNTRRAARQILVTTCPVVAGATFTETNVGSMRASSGISATHYWDVLGKHATRNYDEHEPIGKD